MIPVFSRFHSRDGLDSCRPRLPEALLRLSTRLNDEARVVPATIDNISMRALALILLCLPLVVLGKVEKPVTKLQIGVLVSVPAAPIQ